MPQKDSGNLTEAFRQTVGIAAGPKPWAYSPEAPFLPDEAYPEFQNRVRVGKERNLAYSLFRQLMSLLEIGKGRISSPTWNPFSGLIQPGQKVLVKPNLVRHIHFSGGDYQAVVTHGSLVRCVLDYVAMALQGRGEIVVGDAPVQSADFPKIVEKTGLREVCADVMETWQIPVRLVDFRLWAVQLDDRHRPIMGRELDGDSTGYCQVDLGSDSLLAALGSQGKNYRVTSYDCSEMEKHHNGTKNEYLIPRSVLDSHVVINLPKLKTHRKVGLTGALKNIVGINGHKDWLPHHRSGSGAEGGDEYREPCWMKRWQTDLCQMMERDPDSSFNRVRSLGIRISQPLIRFLAPDLFMEGSWYGNDTLWRTVLDLNRLLIYADREGKMADRPQRQCFSIVDAIIAGEGEGPMEPDASPFGLLIGGVNPVAVDLVLATLIGFDFRKIPLIDKSFDFKKWPLVDFAPEKIRVTSSESGCHPVKEIRPSKSFIPPSGWVGHIECNS